MINLKSFFKPFFLAFIIILIAPSSIADDDNYSPLDSPSFFEGLNTSPAPLSRAATLYAADEMSSVPIEAGLLTISADVTVVYAIK